MSEPHKVKDVLGLLNAEGPVAVRALVATAKRFGSTPEPQPQFEQERADKAPPAEAERGSAAEGSAPEDQPPRGSEGKTSAGTEGRKAPEPFPFTRSLDIEPSLEATDFVEGLLTEGGASVIYGASNVGKSFWVLDLAAHVATGKPWRNGEHEVDQGAVIYVALEGTVGVRNRVEALRRSGLLPRDAPLYVVFASVSLLEPSHVGRMVETVLAAQRDCGQSVRWVIIDTLSRAIAGGDENGAKDMTSAVQAVDEVRRATGAHVSLVHHCGKDEAKGARGHSSLRAAMDTEIELYRAEGEGIVTASIRKQKDLPVEGPFPFSLDQVELGLNRRNKPVTSCTVRHEDAGMAHERGKPGRKPSASPEDVLSLLPAESTKDWQVRAQEEFAVGRSTFYDIKKNLNGNGAVRTPDGRWIRTQ